ncbi:MAG: filament integrity protein FraC [Cyanobacteria bacterium P01_D01_bin.1]
MEYEPILPLRTILFQILFLMVAIVIEAGILRQRLRLGFQTSVQYALVTNLASVVAGWIAFLVIEPLASASIRQQIVSFILFDNLLINGWNTETGAILFLCAIVVFFLAFFIKAKGLEFFLRADDVWKFLAERSDRPLSRDGRYAKARGGSLVDSSIPSFTDTVIQANAASFSVILLLLLLRAVAREWTL